MSTHNKTAAAIDPALRGKVVKPKRVRQRVTTVETGEVKAKHLVPGQRVKPLVKGQAVGGVRIVSRIERENDGATVRVTWRNGYTASLVAAAQRYIDVDRMGHEVTADEVVAMFQEVRR